MPLSINDPVSKISGVGAQRTKVFGGMGIYTVKDLLTYFPRCYEHRGDVIPLRNATADTPQAFILTVDTRARAIPSKSRRGAFNYRINAHDESADCTIMFFNQKYAAESLRPGRRYRFYGKIKYARSGPLLLSPKFEPADTEEKLLGFLPVYPLHSGMTQNILRNTIKTALKETNDISDITALPGAVAEREKFENIKKCIFTLHFPESEDDLLLASKRMLYEELYIFSLCVRLNGKDISESNAPKMKSTDLSPFLSKFSFEPTGAQKKAINDIYRDMVHSEKPMYRLLSGDVGSGKTFPAAAAIYIAAANGYQSAMMAPTEILATQHFNDLSQIFESLGYKTSLLVGSLKESEKKKVRAGLKSGEINIVFGTHALISDSVGFARPGLFITDEQHRFGVNQRKQLAEKGEGIGVLIMSATPIPRTLALMIYGELSVSILDEMPPNRKPVSTYVIGKEKHEKLYEFMVKEIKSGHQAYIVCPAVEEQEDDETPDEIDVSGNFILSNLKLDDIKTNIKLKSAKSHYSDLKAKYPDIRFGLMYGNLSGDEKDAVMADFVGHNTDALVSTTVIEVGVNVPNSTIMIVENAERFGLSQLHQLRGRVGRGSAKSYCFLCSEDTSSKALERLRVLEENKDGFAVAEFDLKQRGPGDFFPKGDEIRQHGELKFRFADLCDDLGVLQSALSDAEKTLAADPELALPENRGAKNTLLQLTKS